ncbi:hypothetical protein [Algibacter sp. 2305UL17-15]|uniref:hypothetical protein n=1 Tax=Algibacter sp. 2305UL17-15 TaxID=3231268 RepID=UPI0034599E72
MIGSICVYFIGKYFFKLARAYNQNKVLYTFLGILSFYIGSLFLGGAVFYYFIGDFNYRGGDIFFSLLNVGVLKMPFGIGLACLFHYLLENHWRKVNAIIEDEIEDIGKSSEIN